MSVPNSRVYVREKLELEKDLFAKEEMLPQWSTVYLWHFNRIPDWHNQGTPSRNGFHFYRCADIGYNRKVPNKFGNVCHDTDYSIIFAKEDGYPLACCGFSWDETGILYVKQLQANRDMRDYLRLFRWERMLLAVTVDWADQMGFDFVWVNPAAKNKYSQINNTKIGRMRYDVTARRESFKFDRDSGMWVRDLRAERKS